MSRRGWARWLIGLGCLLVGIREVEAARQPTDWYRLRSAHFDLYTDTGAREAEQAVVELEMFHRVVSRFLGMGPNQQREGRTLVYFFNEESAFRPFRPKFQGRPREVSGFQVQDPLGNVMAFSRLGRDSSTRRLLLHEFTHVLTSREFRGTPPWLIEGVAEVFSTFEVSGRDCDLGVALTNHAFYLQRSPPMPVRELLEVTHESPDYNESKRAGRFYATSWLLAHYLLFAKRGIETNLLSRYAVRSRASTNQVNAFTTVFGAPPEEFDQRLGEYLKGGRYVIVRQRLDPEPAEKPVREPLAEGEFDLALGRLLQITGQEQEARERLLRASLAMPASPLAAEYMALMAWRLGQRPEMAGSLREALRRNSVNPFVLFLAAEARFQDFSRLRSTLEPPQRRQLLAEGRAWVERAVKLDPGLGRARHLLGVYCVAADPPDRAAALKHLEAGLMLEPDFLPARITYASILAADGKVARAMQVLDLLLQRPLAPELRETAERLKEDLERRMPTSPRRSP